MVLQRIIDLAAEVTDARYGALGVIGAGDLLIDFITTMGGTLRLSSKTGKGTKLRFTFPV
jgi:hypothetical protein